MKDLLKELFNKNKKTVKITGTITANPEYLVYEVRTRSGTMLVDATQRYNIGQDVVIYDNVIQNVAGRRQTITNDLV